MNISTKFVRSCLDKIRSMKGDLKKVSFCMERVWLGWTYEKVKRVIQIK